jgi:hypothetical protein
MKNAKPNGRKTAVLIAAILFLTGLQLATSARTVAGGVAEVDLSAESRSLDSFVNDLGKFDKKNSELSKKATLTRLEFDTHQRDAESLKGRLAGVQNALREAIRKLKAAGQWDNLDQFVLAKISDPRFQELVRRDGFKKTLEEAASQLSNDASEISKPLDLLRNKIRAQAPETVFEPRHSELSSRAVGVAYHPASIMFTTTVRCRISYLRAGITGAFGGRPSDNSINAVNCFCYGDGDSCTALFTR